MATDFLRHFLVRAPEDVAAVTDLGVGFANAGDAVAGSAWLRRATQLSAGDPVLAEAVAALGLRIGDFPGACRFLRRTLVDAPQHALRHVTLARAESHLEPHGPWRQRVLRAAACDPQSDEVRWVSAALERQFGRLADARRAARAAVTLRPGAPDGLAEVARAEHGFGQAPAASGWLRRALAIASDRVDLANLLVLVEIYFADTRSIFAAVHRHAAIGRAVPIGGGTSIVDPDPGRRLRVAYVSADFHDHPVGHNLIGLVEGHDRDQFQPHFYSNVLRADDLTRRFSAAGEYRSIVGLGDRRVTEVVAADRIDILVNLAGRFTGNRPGLPAWRAAPVQLAMHDLTSSGDRATTATLLDEDLHPAASTEAFVEPVIRLPCFYLFDVPTENDPLTASSAGNRPLTFGSANNPAKWSTSTLRLWAQLLMRLPCSRLWLNFHGRTADPATRAVLARRLADHGLPLDRVDFGEGTSTKEAHLAALSRIDIALDPAPFSGATSTFEALWMGLPVVAMAGDRVAGRISATLLRHAGLEDLVARDGDAYIAIALRLAEDPSRRLHLRRTLRSALRLSPLLDRAAYVRSVERAYRDAWAAACAAHQRRHTSR